MIPASVLPRIAIGIVTYGERWKLLEQVIERVINDPIVGAIWVVDNGSSFPISPEIEKRCWSERVKVLRNDDNKGSAVGYAQVLRVLSDQTTEPLLYLLDDDNRPEHGAISAAVGTWVELGSDPELCCLSLRNDRPEQKSALQNATPLRHRKNSFAGFHVAEAFKRLIAGKNTPQREAVGSIDVDYAPYGGLLMHRSWLPRIGLPKEAYYLYADDHEFTSRIVRSGGRILLVADSRVEDLETSWHLKPVAARAGIFSASSPNFRLYYSIRNRVDFERLILVDSLPTYFFNIGINLSIRFFRALIAERNITESLQKLRIAIRAISDGWSGQLDQVKGGLLSENSHN